MNLPCARRKSGHQMKNPIYVKSCKTRQKYSVSAQVVVVSCCSMPFSPVEKARYMIF